MIAELHSSTLNVPIEIIDYALANKLEKALIIFLLLKSSCNGVISAKSVDFAALGAVVNINTVKTFRKHLKTLIELNWIGFNRESKNYFIRSFSKIRQMHKLPGRAAVSFSFKDFPEYKAFFTGAVINHNIRQQQFAFNKSVIRRYGKSALSSESALQDYHKSLGFAGYFGKSNKGIGKLLHCGKSQANRLKMRAEQQGFIKTRKQYKKLAELKEFDGNIKNYLEQKHKVRFKKVKRNGEYIIQVLQQLHDEIIPKLKFRRLETV